MILNECIIIIICYTIKYTFEIILMITAQNAFIKIIFNDITVSSFNSFSKLNTVEIVVLK